MSRSLPHRPRHAARVRLFAPALGRHHRAPDASVLTRVLAGLHRLGAAA
ncbi:hypothetical protein [Nocardiopsis dassonvillei]